MAKKGDVVGSGNVFADVGHPRPAEALAKTELARKISAIIERRGLTQAAAAAVLEIDQPKVSALARGRLAGFPLDRLVRFLGVPARRRRVSSSRRAMATAPRSGAHIPVVAGNASAAVAPCTWSHAGRGESSARCGALRPHATRTRARSGVSRRAASASRLSLVQSRCPETYADGSRCTSTHPRPLPISPWTSRNPSSTSRRRSRLVAAITRTLTRRVRSSPTRSNSPS